MIDKLIEKYKQLVEENYDEDNCFADLSKAIAYQEIIQDLEKLKSKQDKTISNIENLKQEYSLSLWTLEVITKVIESLGDDNNE